MTKEIPMILPNFHKQNRSEKGIVRSLVISFIGLAYEGISRHCHIKRQNALQKAFGTMENNVNLAKKPRIFHLENSMIYKWYI